MTDWNEPFQAFALVAADEDPVDPAVSLNRGIATGRRHFEWACQQNSKARYTTACGAKDVLDRWRENHQASDVLTDIEGDGIVADCLSMFHSPRVKGDFVYLPEFGRGMSMRVNRLNDHKGHVIFCDGIACGRLFAATTPLWPFLCSAAYRDIE